MNHLTVLLALGHAPDMDADTLDAADQTGADLVLWSELYRPAGLLVPRRGDLRTKVAHSATDTRLVLSPHGDAGDNPISTRRGVGIRLLWRMAWRVTRPGPRVFRKWTPERWLYVERILWDGAHITVVSAHPDPLFCGLRRWSKVMAAVEKIVQRAEARGDEWIVGGDLQTKRRARRLFDRLGGNAWCVGVGWIAHSRGLVRSRGFTLRPEGMDHQWMLAKLRRAR